MKANEARVWMNYAKTDLPAARALLKSGEFFPLQICFLSPQCAEKAIKAILVFEEVDFPDLAELTIWAVDSRYPDNTPNVVESEARETLQLAEAVFDAVNEELEIRF